MQFASAHSEANRQHRLSILASASPIAGTNWPVLRQGDDVFSIAQAMMTPPEEYRTRAAECLRFAPTMLDSLARDTLVHMAAHWARLADFHEASRNLQDIPQHVSGTPSPRAHAVS